MREEIVYVASSPISWNITEQPIGHIVVGIVVYMLFDATFHTGSISSVQTLNCHILFLYSAISVTKFVFILYFIRCAYCKFKSCYIVYPNWNRGIWKLISCKASIYLSCTVNTEVADVRKQGVGIKCPRYSPRLLGMIWVFTIEISDAS